MNGSLHSLLFANGVPPSGHATSSGTMKVGKPPHPLVQCGECWLWTGRVDSNGYGIIRLDGHPCHVRSMQAHRYYWMAENGDVPAGKHLHHTCCRPGCCNPDHLIPVTFGEHMRLHNLKVADCLIVALALVGCEIKEMALLLQVSISTIYRRVRGLETCGLLPRATR